MKKSYENLADAFGQCFGLAKFVCHGKIPVDIADELNLKMHRRIMRYPCIGALEYFGDYYACYEHSYKQKHLDEEISDEQIRAKAVTYLGEVFKRDTDKIAAAFFPDGEIGRSLVFIPENIEDSNALRADEASGHLAKGTGTIAGVLDHELGHALHNHFGRIALDACEKAKTICANCTYPKSCEMLRLAYDEYEKRKDAGSIRVDLSAYAISNLGEFFAECFAEYKNHKAVNGGLGPRLLAKTVGKQIDLANVEFTKSEFTETLEVKLGFSLDRIERYIMALEVLDFDKLDGQTLSMNSIISGLGE